MLLQPKNKKKRNTWKVFTNSKTDTSDDIFDFTTTCMQKTLDLLFHFSWPIIDDEKE